MNNTIYQKMKQFKEENHARHAWFTVEEWSHNLDMTITPQRMGAMFRAGLVMKDNRGKSYWGDNKARYDIEYKYEE